MYDKDAYTKEKIMNIKKAAIAFTIIGIGCFIPGIIFFASGVAPFLNISAILLICIACGFWISYSVKIDKFKKHLAGITPKKEIDDGAASVNSIDGEKMKTRLFGMIKSMKKINVKQASDILGIEKKTLQNLLFELVGEEKINGEFTDNDTFIIASGVEAFITALDAQFANWSKKEQTKDGKLDFPSL